MSQDYGRLRRHGGPRQTNRSALMRMAPPPRGSTSGEPLTGDAAELGRGRGQRPASVAGRSCGATAGRASAPPPPAGRLVGQRARQKGGTGAGQHEGHESLALGGLDGHVPLDAGRLQGLVDQRRVDVPGPVVIRGIPARAVTGSGRLGPGSVPGGSTTSTSWVTRGSKTRPSSGSGSSESPISHRPVRIRSTNESVSSGSATRTITPGWATRKAPINPARGPRPGPGGRPRRGARPPARARRPPPNGPWRRRAGPGGPAPATPPPPPSGAPVGPAGRTAPSRARARGSGSPAERGLADEQPFGGPGEPAFVHDRDHVLKLAQFHRLSLCLSRAATSGPPPPVRLPGTDVGCKYRMPASLSED